jgi:hypothetical protein
MCLKAGRTRWCPSTPTGCAMSGCVVSARKRREPTAARYADGSTRGSPSAVLWCVALATCGRMVGLQSAMPCRASIASTSLGLVSLRPPSGIRSIRRSTCWRDDGSPVVVSERWWLAALWSESEPASTVFALLFARHPQAAAQRGQCDQYEKVVVVGPHSRILTVTYLSLVTPV